MADIIVDGLTKVAFVPTIANKNAPTVAELTAGDDLEMLITADGLEGFEADTAEVDTTALGSTFDTKTTGRTSFSGTALVLKKQSGTDAVFTTLKVRGTSGYLVIRDGISNDTAWAATQQVQVYPVTTGQWFYLPREANSVLRYRVPMPITDEPALDATTAA